MLTDVNVRGNCWSHSFRSISPVHGHATYAALSRICGQPVADRQVYPSPVVCRCGDNATLYYDTNRQGEQVVCSACGVSEYPLHHWAEKSGTTPAALLEKLAAGGSLHEYHCCQYLDYWCQLDARNSRYLQRLAGRGVPRNQLPGMYEYVRYAGLVSTMPVARWANGPGQYVCADKVENIPRFLHPLPRSETGYAYNLSSELLFAPMQDFPGRVSGLYCHAFCCPGDARVTPLNTVTAAPGGSVNAGLAGLDGALASGRPAICVDDYLTFVRLMLSHAQVSLHPAPLVLWYDGDSRTLPATWRVLSVTGTPVFVAWRLTGRLLRQLVAADARIWYSPKLADDLRRAEFLSAAPFHALYEEAMAGADGWREFVSRGIRTGDPQVYKMVRQANRLMPVSSMLRELGVDDIRIAAVLAGAEHIEGRALSGGYWYGQGQLHKSVAGRLRPVTNGYIRVRRLVFDVERKQDFALGYVAVSGTRAHFLVPWYGAKQFDGRIRETIAASSKTPRLLLYRGLKNTRMVQLCLEAHPPVRVSGDIAAWADAYRREAACDHLAIPDTYLTRYGLRHINR